MPSGGSPKVPPHLLLPGWAAAAVKFAFAENALHKTRLSVLYAWLWFRTRGPAAIITGPLPR